MRVPLLGGRERERERERGGEGRETIASNGEIKHLEDPCVALKSGPIRQEEINPNKNKEKSRSLSQDPAIKLMWNSKDDDVFALSQLKIRALRKSDNTQARLQCITFQQHPESIYYDKHAHMVNGVFQVQDAIFDGVADIVL